MLFNSYEFLIFLPIVFLLYWFVAKNNSRIQNLIIILASYLFYGWWDWRFLLLIIFSTLIDFYCGLAIEKSPDKIRKRYLWLSIMCNLGLLGYFKYYNFFVDSFIYSFSQLGITLQASSLHIILPVGISFYTFQTLSYTIDIYKEKLKPTYSLISFAAFVSFFPQLVAGPIERATNLLPQFFQKRKFDYSKARNGFKQILWGFFKKLVIADNCAEYADMVFNNSASQPGSTLFLGAFFFAFQIYGDFSGYSDIAIGTARLFGVDLMQNFAFPYFSRNVAEFWKRWHISLSTWFRDYVYIPLGGNKKSTQKTVLNTFIVFLVSGLWHGANWTFIVWGLIHTLYFIPLLIMNRTKKHAHLSSVPQLKDAFSILITFVLTTIAWVFFRAENIYEAINYITGLFNSSIISIPTLPKQSILIIILILFFNTLEWLGRRDKFAIENMFENSPQFIRWCFYSSLLLIIGLYMQTEETPFIYFQF